MGKLGDIIAKSNMPSNKSKVKKESVKPLTEAEVRELKKDKPDGWRPPNTKLTNLWNAKIKFFGDMISGYPLTVSSYVINNSAVDCGPFKVKFTIKGKDKYVEVKGLKAGQGVQVSVPCNTDWGSTQTINVETTVDPDGKIEEFNEKDNTQKGNITIAPPYSPPKKTK